MNELFRLENVTAGFGTQIVLRNFDLTIYDKERVAVCGPSGTGKSTFLRCLNLLEHIRHGVIYFRGEKIIEAKDGAARVLVDENAHRARVGIVFQEYTLFPHMNVLKNVMYGLHGMSRQAAQQRALQVLSMVGMEALAQRRPQELSGGQQQRIALARSMAPAPRLILLDEPFSNLDESLRAATRQEIKTLLKSHGMTALLVTHDQEEALSFADRLGVMNAGRLEQTGEPEEVYRRPATPFVADFLGRTNLLEVRRGPAEGRVLTPLGEMGVRGTVSGCGLVSIRPEHLRMEAEEGTGGPECGWIVVREFKGHDLTFKVEIAGRQYTVQTDYSCPLRVGQRVRLVALEPAVAVGG